MHENGIGMVSQEEGRTGRALLGQVAVGFLLVSLLLGTMISSDVLFGVAVERDNDGSRSLAANPPGPNAVPVASFAADPTVVQPSVNVTFDASSSYDPDGGPLNFSWDFDDGASGFGVQTLHNYPAAGQYLVVLTVRDSDNDTNSTSTTITVDDSPPATEAVLLGTPGNPPWYKSIVDVELNVADQSEVPWTNYSLDSGPWQPYGGRFSVTIQGNHSVEYYSTDAAGNEESPKTTNFGIDTVPPATTLSANGTLGGGGWYTSSVVVTLNATDATSGVQAISYQLNGGILVEYSLPFELPGDGNPDGVYDVSYYAEDTAGLTESPKTVSIRIDRAAPATLYQLSGTQSPSGWFVTPVGVTLTAMDVTSDVASIQWQLDGGGFSTYTGPFSIAAEGNHNLEYRATDTAGNVELTQSLLVGIDTVAPTTVATLGGMQDPSGWFSSSVEVTLTATDSTSGPASIHVRVDGGVFQTYAGPFTVATEGDHTLEFYAVDAAGNPEEVQTASFRIDTIAPVTVLGLNGTLGLNGWYVSAVVVSLSASDDRSGVETIYVRVNNGTWNTYSVPFQLTDGIHLVEYYAEDLAGVSEAVQSVVLSIDRRGPLVSVAFDGTFGENGWYVTSALVTLTGTDAHAGVDIILVRIDEGVWLNYTGPFLIEAEGSHVLETYGIDRAGNAGLVERRVANVDPVPPVTTFTAEGVQGANNWYLSFVRVILTGVDNGSHLARTMYRLDAGDWRNYTGAFTFFSDGIRFIEYSSIDRAGNQEAISGREIWVDRTDPESVSSLAGTMGGESWFVSSVVVNLTATDAMSGLYRIVYQLDGGPWLVYGAEIHVATTGQHVLVHQAIDRAGNEETFRVVLFGIDFVAPLSTAHLNGTLGTAGWFVAPVEVSFTLFDADSGRGTISYRVDGGLWEVYAGPFLVGDGRHRLEYWAEDLARNAEAIRLLLFDVDSSPPVFGQPSPTGVVASSTVEMRWNASDATSGLAGFSLSIDGAPFISLGTNSSYLVSVSDGTHVVVVRARDLAGNEADAEFRFRADTNVFSLTGPQAGAPTYVILVLGIGVLLLVTWRLGGGGKEAGPPLE